MKKLVKPSNLTGYPLSGWFAIGVSALGLLVLIGILSVSADAKPPLQSTGPAERTTFFPEDMVDNRLRVVYHVVGSDLRVTSYDNTSLGRAPRRESYGDAITNDAPADLRFVVFENVSLINMLNDQALDSLLNVFEGSRLIIGAEGFGRDLKAALGLLDPSLADAVTTTGGDGLWVLLHRSPAGHLNELIIDAPDKSRPRHAVEDAFKLMRDWFNRNEVFVDPAVTDGEDPWDAIHNFEWSGYTIGYFGTASQQQTVGTYKFTLSLYTVSSNQDNNDWYRMDFQTISEVTNYEMTGDSFGDTSGKCGWWTESMYAAATVTTPGGQWWDYMPSSTVGSTTTGFTIGGNITTTQAGVNAAYSQSYGQPDVTITVEANSVSQALDWEASLVGCGNYSDYPYYSGASSVARSTYDLNPSFIIAVPTGSKMTVKTTAPDPTTVEPWRFTVRKDTVEVCNLVEICSTHYTETYHIETTITCTQSGCS